MATMFRSSSLSRETGALSQSPSAAGTISQIQRLRRTIRMFRPTAPHSTICLISSISEQSRDDRGSHQLRHDAGQGSLYLGRCLYFRLDLSPRMRLLEEDDNGQKDSACVLVPTRSYTCLQPCLRGRQSR